jgi:thiamine phosphate synthase YjbQ (UPF0047 family)
MEGSGSFGACARWPGAEAAGSTIDFGVSVGRVHLRTTEALGVFDLTARVEGFVRAAGLEAGWVNVQTRHTTTGICVNEDEPLLLADLQTLVAAGRLQLGRWQRVLLLELDGPREREVSLLAMGERRR